MTYPDYVKVDYQNGTSAFTRTRRRVSQSEGNLRPIVQRPIIDIDMTETLE